MKLVLSLCLLAVNRIDWHSLNRPFTSDDEDYDDADDQDQEKASYRCFESYAKLEDVRTFSS